MHNVKARPENWTLARSTEQMLLVWITLLGAPILAILLLAHLELPVFVSKILPAAAGAIFSGYLGQALGWRERAGAADCGPKARTATDIYRALRSF